MPVNTCERDQNGRLLPIPHKNCDNCGRDYKPAIVKQRFCSRECAGTQRQHWSEGFGQKYLSEDYDWAAVVRLLDGSPVRSTPAERYRAAVRLFGYGLSNGQIAQRIRCTQRTAERYRARYRAGLEVRAA